MYEAFEPVFEVFLVSFFSCAFLTGHDEDLSEPEISDWLLVLDMFYNSTSLVQKISENDQEIPQSTLQTNPGHRGDE